MVFNKREMKLIDYKKAQKFTGIGTFTKDIHIGKWCFAVSHTEEGGEV